jgi:CubicO group peptidase (beta-lactamase class C family)
MTEWPDAASSDPAVLQWMVGSPPPADKLIQFADGSAFRFPRTRWTYSNMRRLVPTSVVPRGGVAAALPRAERPDLDAVTFTPTGQDAVMTWEQSLAANFTDGILVLHRGHVVYERYFGVLDAATPHLAFSVTKSFVATIAGILAAEGALDDGATVATYLPELQSSGFADATIAQLLDMTTGVKHTEDYVDDKAGIWDLARAGNFRPRPADYKGPGSFYEYLQTVARDCGHGERFAYKTANTDVLGWVLRRVTGKTTSRLMFDYLWSKLGVEQDAYFTIDTTGVEFAGAGLNLALPDLARFGEMMRQQGRFNGRQVVPAAVVDDIRAGGNRPLFAGAGYTQLPGWSYRRMWWVSHNEHGAFAARGIHGQTVYIDPAAEMVVARFASHPQGANMHLDPASLPAYHALAKHLRKNPS